MIEEYDDGFTRESFERQDEDTGDDEPMTEEENRAQAARNMIIHGGGFAAALGDLYFRADSGNAAKILQAWPELFEKYHARNWP